MNKKFLISWVVVFVVWMAGSFAIHGAWLAELYAQHPNLYRTESDTQALFYLMLIAHVIMAGAFVWIYQRGAEDKPWLTQGIRFGIAIALLAVVPTYTIYYVVQPMSGNLAVQQIIGESVLVLILGIIVAFLNKSTDAAT
ncbi:MAG: hypothetical protein OER22_09640 [Gammaproteobacteria bacterium]|nr:hypothetical protein [Gammaproteobacteria bacterium]MDH3408747.1 hypothetical protein [Gammaproteobacteria bacterium]MDH3552863.1 hypothetical protein [Gammaproteobacteria bacterium]